jgi:hypothetical protein
MPAATMFLAACAPQAGSGRLVTMPHAEGAPERGVTQSQGSDSESQTPAQIEDAALTAVVNALVAHDYARALDLTETSTSTSPWLDYDRAEALVGLGSTDEALQSFERARQKFHLEGPNVAGESVALWGRAHALAEAGRCSQATAAYEQYAVSVQKAHPAAAQMAREYSKACRPVPALQ